MALPLRAVGALSVPLASLSVFTAAPVAQAAGIPPPPTKRLPAALDIAPPYQRQTLCHPTAKPGAVAFAKLLNGHYGTRYYGISRNCNSGVTEHSEGRALDWMINANDPAQKALADSIVTWLSATDGQGRPGAMARRFGINYIIWNRRMWRAYDPGRGWAAYSGDSPHTDHIHFTFTWDGAYQRTSWWTGTALTTITIGPTTTTTSTGYPLLQLGSRGSYVTMVQKVVGTAADGDFGSMTKAAVTAWQKSNGVPQTGMVDDATWARMIALGKVPALKDNDLAPYADTTIRLGSRGDAVRALQRTLGGLEVDGDFGARTDAAVRSYQRAKGLTVNGVVDPPVWKVLMGGKTPTIVPEDKTVTTTGTLTTEFTLYKRLTLRVGSTGNAVRVVQRALGGLEVDGSYGSRTAAAVTAFRRTARLPAGTTVDKAVWNALELRAHPLLPFWNTVVRRGSTGPAVVALQKALRVEADGDFGSVTDGAVRDLQKAAALSVNGVVGTLTWRAVEKRMR